MATKIGRRAALSARVHARGVPGLGGTPAADSLKIWTGWTWSSSTLCRLGFSSPGDLALCRPARCWWCHRQLRRQRREGGGGPRTPSFRVSRRSRSSSTCSASAAISSWRGATSASWSIPLASGLLTGKMSERTTFDASDHRSYAHAQAFDVGETFVGVDYEAVWRSSRSCAVSCPEAPRWPRWRCAGSSCSTASRPRSPREVSQQARANAAAADLVAVRDDGIGSGRCTRSASSPSSTSAGSRSDPRQPGVQAAIDRRSLRVHARAGRVGSMTRVSPGSGHVSFEDAARYPPRPHQ